MKKRIALLLSLAFLLAAPPLSRAASAQPPTSPPREEAVFAGGCFWCTQHDFEEIPGVVAVVAGYTGGTVPNPTYEQVSSGTTGHVEAVEVTFDPAKITYGELLTRFWHLVDPTAADRQFCDVGPEYRSEIFFLSPRQEREAEESKTGLEKTKPFSQPIVTLIRPAGPFYRAEEYHQDYWKKNPLRYRFYRFNCGRDRRLKELWGNETGR